MMQKYSTFLILFLIAFVASIVLMGSYLYTVFDIAANAVEFGQSSNPFEVFSIFFNPLNIISLVVAGITGLLYRIVAIVSIASHQTAPGGEKALWIIGFLLMGFITGIIYLVLAKQRGYAV